MSEYQYYEFQAVDRPLSPQAMADLRALSTRATITPTRFVNVYNWGNFRGDPARLMETYFDAFVYVANWGTHEYMLRLPQRLLDPQLVAQYCVGENAEAWTTPAWVIVAFRCEDEPLEDVDDGEGWLPALLPLRGDLASGDLRCLYLGWLRCAQSGLLEDDAEEPPLPSGLDEPSAALQALIDFLRLDDDLVAIAAAQSPPVDETAASRPALVRWIASLSEAEKNAVLLRLLEGQEPHLRADLLRQLRQARSVAAEERARVARRTVGDLLTAAQDRAEQRRRVEAAREAQERARREQQQAAVRRPYLADLAERAPAAWQRVDALIATRRPADYDLAVQLLVDLQELSQRSGQSARFAERLRALRTAHGRKPSLLARFDQAGLAASP